MSPQIQPDSESPQPVLLTSSPCVNNNPSLVAPAESLSSNSQLQAPLVAPAESHPSNSQLQAPLVLENLPGATTSSVSPLLSFINNSSSSFTASPSHTNYSSSQVNGLSSAVQTSPLNQVVSTIGMPTSSVSANNISMPRLTSAYSLLGTNEPKPDDNPGNSSSNNSSATSTFQQNPRFLTKQPIRPLPVLPTSSPVGLNNSLFTAQLSSHLTSKLNNQLSSHPPSYSALPTFLSSQSAISSSTLSTPFLSPPPSFSSPSTSFLPSPSPPAQPEIPAHSTLLSSVNPMTPPCGTSSHEDSSSNARASFSSPTVKRMCPDGDGSGLKSDKLTEFCSTFRGRLTALIAGSFHTNILGKNSFFDRFGAFK